jgi:hypothetical protein
MSVNLFFKMSKVQSHSKMGDKYRDNVQMGQDKSICGVSKSSVQQNYTEHYNKKSYRSQFCSAIKI